MKLFATIKPILLLLDARPFLQLSPGAPVDFEANTNLNTGRTDIRFRQLAAPQEYPACIFKNSVAYDLTGQGRRTAEAVITNARVLQTVINQIIPAALHPF